MFAQAPVDIKISGTVKNSKGNALKDAVVSIINAGKSTRTDSTGAYSITYQAPTAAAQLTPKHRDFNAVGFQGNAICFSVTGGQARVVFGVYALTGQAVACVYDRTLASGFYRIAPTVFHVPSQIYLLKVRIGDRSTILRALCFNGKLVGKGSELLQESISAGTSVLSKKMVATDSMLVTKFGYKISRIGIDSYTGTFNFSLDSSTDTGLVNAVYLNTVLPLDNRVWDLVDRMTLQEKAQSLDHSSGGISRLKVPLYDGWCQCLHGIWESSKTTTLFPVPIAMAASWDTALVRSITNAISDEARALHNTMNKGLVYRAPVINVDRSPFWGRIEECFGEDPYLDGRIGISYVKGLNGNDPKYLKVAATLKHYAVYNVETNRLALSATVSERMLHEYFLPHFQACVVEGGAQSLMASYNRINGVHAAKNSLLLTGILRGMWDFNGFVVSDLGGIGNLITVDPLYSVPAQAVADAINDGCDYDDDEYMNLIPTAVQTKLLSIDTVNRSVARVTKVAMRLGAFDPPASLPWAGLNAATVHSATNQALALKTEQEAIVLLTNNNNILPLDKTKLSRVAVIGPVMINPEYGEYYDLASAPVRVSPLDGIKNALGSAVVIDTATGCSVTGAAVQANIDSAANRAKRADVVILCLGTTRAVEAENNDRTSLGLPGAQQQLLQSVVRANPKTIVVLSNGGPLSTKWARDSAAAMLEVWYPGEQGGNAIATVLFGSYNPGGKLPYTVYELESQVPPQTEYDITKGFTYMYNKYQPVFPFGYGLSYTTFSYSNLQISQNQITAKGSLTISADIQNTGTRAGDEIAQLYVHDSVSSVVRPIKELRGFQRVSLNPGQKKTVTFVLRGDQLAFWDEVTKHDFVVEPGFFSIMVGASSQDIRLSGQIEVM
jgi:beta-glucosidase